MTLDITQRPAGSVVIIGAGTQGRRLAYMVSERFELQRRKFPLTAQSGPEEAALFVSSIFRNSNCKMVCATCNSFAMQQWATTEIGEKSQCLNQTLLSQFSKTPGWL